MDKIIVNIEKGESNEKRRAAAKSELIELVINRPPNMPESHTRVLIAGGVGYYNEGRGTWHTVMQCCEPVIMWEVKWWAELPQGL